MREALRDPRLLGNALPGESWSTWRTFLIAMMGEKLRAPERRVFQKFTGREREPLERIEEALLLIGRRGGKDAACSVLAAYLAGLVDWSHVLRKGERGVLLVIGADTRQAQIQRGYIEGVFDASPMLSALVINRTQDTIELLNGVVIEVRAANFRRNRGMTAIGIIGTEFAFLLDETSANPDTEILTALRPSLLTTRGPLVVITTPYAARGEVFNIYRRHFGPTGDPRILVAQGTSQDFNPTIDPAVIARATERDPVAAAAEFGAQFRTDLEEFVNRAAVEACVVRGVFERPPHSNIHYVAFIDPSGGSSDAMTMAIAHREGRVVVLDCLRWIPAPFAPNDVCAEFARTLKAYRVHTVQADKYAGAWVEQAFRMVGIRCEQSAAPKSDLYLSLLPTINSGQASLLDDTRLVNELCGLERRTAGSGKDSIDHRPGAHDDLANSVAGVVNRLIEPQPVQWTPELVERIRTRGTGEREILMREHAMGRI
jgi:hypothetical protein